MKYIALVILLTFTASFCYSQQKTEKQRKKEEREERINRLIMQEEQGAIIFQRQTVFGIKLNSDGYGMFLEMARMKTSRKANLYSLELGERKHPKEERVTSTAAYLSNPYVFGKINNFYYAKLGYFQQRMIGNKGNRNGVAVSAIYGGGFSAGLLKPYFIKVKNATTEEIRDVRYKGDSISNAYFLDANQIVGATGFTKGFGFVKFVPGLFAQASMRFDYGRYNELVSAFEVGINAEFYTQKMNQLLLVKPKQFFVNAFAAIEFGRRK